jgi:hypothetical protein
MARGRVLLVLSLAYVGLDFCLPAMPGVFVLTPAGYVDALDVAHARVSIEAVPIVAPATDDGLSRPQLDARPCLPSTDNVVRPERTLVNCLPRARCVSPPPAEEPH